MPQAHFDQWLGSVGFHFFSVYFFLGTALGQFLRPAARLLRAGFAASAFPLPPEPLRFDDYGGSHEI
jgi:hypothetical protein